MGGSQDQPRLADDRDYGRHPVIGAPQAGSRRPVLQPSTIVGVGPFVPPANGLCAFDRLPAEIISRVFLLGTLQSRYDRDHPGRRAHLFRYVSFERIVSHVCRRWREIALGAPALWTDVIVLEGMPYDKTKAYLSRSKNAPLDLFVSAGRPSHDAADDGSWEAKLRRASRSMEELAALLPLLADHSHRWRTLELGAQGYVSMQLALIVLHGLPSAPVLEELRLTNHQRIGDLQPYLGSALPFKHPVLFHGRAPKLRFLALKGVRLNWAESPFLYGLTELQLTYHTPSFRPSFRDLARILRESPRLVRLNMWHSGPRGGSEDWPVLGNEPVDLSSGDASKTMLYSPSLRYFSVSSFDPTYLTAWARRWAFPNLESFGLHVQGGDCRDLLRVLTQPAPGVDKPLLALIHTFVLTSMPCNDAYLIAKAYRTMDNVDALSIDFRYVGFEWYNQLCEESCVASEMREECLPRWTTLSSEGLGGSQLFSLVTIREAVENPLELLLVAKSDPVSREDRRWLNTKLKLSYTPRTDDCIRTLDADWDEGGLGGEFENMSGVGV